MIGKKKSDKQFLVYSLRFTVQCFDLNKCYSLVWLVVDSYLFSRWWFTT